MCAEILLLLHTELAKARNWRVELGAARQLILGSRNRGKVFPRFSPSPAIIVTVTPSACELVLTARKCLFAYQKRPGLSFPAQVLRKNAGNPHVALAFLSHPHHLEVHICERYTTTSPEAHA
jgi:hypothetical protein